MHKLSRAQHLCLAALFICAILLAVMFAPYIARLNGTSTLNVNANTLTPLVGTWRSEHGNIINFRSDGTARARSSASDQEIGYFEWTVSSKELEVFQIPRNIRGRMLRYVIGVSPTSRFEVLEIMSDQFQLSDPESGKRIRFTKTNDPLLETAR